MVKEISGFSLIECMVYLSCTTIACMFVFTCMSTLYREYMQLKNAQSQHLYLQLVRDLVRRDLMGASKQAYDYDTQQVSFKKYLIDLHGHRYSTWVGYQATPKGLARYQGLYDPATHTWSKRSTSYLPPCCQKLECSVVLDQHTQLVRCVIISYGVKLHSEFRTLVDRCTIKNGMVV